MLDISVCLCLRKYMCSYIYLARTPARAYTHTYSDVSKLVELWYKVCIEREYAYTYSFPPGCAHEDFPFPLCILSSMCLSTTQICVLLPRHVLLTDILHTVTTDRHTTYC